MGWGGAEGLRRCRRDHYQRRVAALGCRLRRADNGLVAGVAVMLEASIERLKLRVATLGSRSRPLRSRAGLAATASAKIGP